MLASRLIAPGRIVAEEVPIPVLGPDQVLVGMETGAICGSDLHIVFGGFEPANLPARPGYPGHEGVGNVVESKSPLFHPGDAVLSVPEAVNASCFAGYQIAESRSLIKLTRGADLTVLVLAQQLGTVIFAMKRFWPKPGGKYATVIGAGSIGLFFLQILKRIGFGTVIVSELEADRRAIAGRLGADLIVNPHTDSVVDATYSLTQGRGADLVIEAAGSDSTRDLAIRSAAPGGRVGLFGYPERKGAAPFPFAHAFRKGLSLEMNRNAQLEPGLKSFREAVRLIAENQIEVDYLLSELVALKHIDRAFEMARDHRVVKVRIDLRQGGKRGEAKP